MEDLELVVVRVTEELAADDVLVPAERGGRKDVGLTLMMPWNLNFGNLYIV